VDNGKIITAGAFMSGMDAALHIVSRAFGEPRAREVANNLEYQWGRDPAWVRAKLPDHMLTALSDFNNHGRVHNGGCSAIRLS
jgi:transcriptional regulator GlxA family with amidase domain